MYVYWVDTLEHIIFFGTVIGLTKVFGPKIRKLLDDQVDKNETALKESFGANLKSKLFHFFFLRQRLKINI